MAHRYLAPVGGYRWGGGTCAAEPGAGAGLGDKERLVLQVKENNYNVTVHDYTGQPLDMKLPQINNILLGFAKGLVALRGPPRGNVPTTLGADPAKLESADGTNVEAVEDADCEITAPTSPETSDPRRVQKEKQKKLMSASKKMTVATEKACLIAIGSESKSEAPTPPTSEDEGSSERGSGALGAHQGMARRYSTGFWGPLNTDLSMWYQDENTDPDNERVDNHGGNVHIDNDDDDNIFED
ncbi:hypothetical protein H4Q26_001425 [Puccinia striiformis f. sp. tritici PST-130]|nr:hypothetical protein H4Q26_001425 [Puccinia striiformis f. sp. tritici PST-130]